MECSCNCDLYYDECEIINPCTIKFPRARKKWECRECGRPIEIGGEYELIKGICGGEFVEFRTCLGCQRLRDDMHFCGGGLADAVMECLGVDIRWSSNGKTP